MGIIHYACVRVRVCICVCARVAWFTSAEKKKKFDFFHLLFFLTSFALASFVTRPDPGSGSPCCVAYFTRLVVSKSPSTSLMPLSLCENATMYTRGEESVFGREGGGRLKFSL